MSVPGSSPLKSFKAMMSASYLNYPSILLSLLLLTSSVAGCGGGGGGGGGGDDPTEGAGPADDGPGDRQLFVSPGGSDSNDGSAGSPFRTISAAAKAARPGDTITISGGRYEELVRINRSGTEGHPITFVAAPGELVVIDGGGGNKDAVVIAGNWIVFRGLVIENGGQKGLLVLSNDNLIDGVVARGNRGPGIQLFKGERNVIAHSIAHDNFDPRSGGEDGDGISLSGNGNLVVSCQAYNNSDDGFDAWQSMNATIERSVAHHNGSGPRGDGNGFKLSNRSGGNTVARKNIAYENGRRGFTNNGGNSHSFVNNTAWNNQINFQSTNRSGNQFINNLSFSGGLDISKAEERNNSWNLDISDPGAVSQDPASDQFLTPAPGSAVIDKGIDVGLPFQGAAQDLGALELGERITDLLR